MDTPQFKAGMNYVRDLLVTHKAALVPGPDVNAANLFAGGKIAMTQAGYPAHFTPAKSDRRQVQVGPRPDAEGAGRQARHLADDQRPDDLSISTKQKEAWQFIKWLMEPKNHIPACWPAARGRRCATASSTTRNWARNCGGTSASSWRPRRPSRGRCRPTTAGRSSTDRRPGLRRRLVGQEDADEALPDAKSKLQAVLAKPAID